MRRAEGPSFRLLLASFFGVSQRYKAYVEGSLRCPEEIYAFGGLYKCGGNYNCVPAVGFYKCGGNS